jgi:hypothetical protein
VKEKYHPITLSSVKHPDKPTFFNKHSLRFLDDSIAEREIIYNEILIELQELEYNVSYRTLRNMLRNYDNPNDFIKGVITRNSDTKSTLGHRLNIIEHYIGQDLMNLFL